MKKFNGGLGIQSFNKYSNMVLKFGKGMIIEGSILSWGSSVYNNFTNSNYTTGEAFGASTMDAAYYAGIGIGTYYVGVGWGIVGTVAIYYLGELLDYLIEKWYNNIIKIYKKWNSLISTKTRYSSLKENCRDKN